MRRGGGKFAALQRGAPGHRDARRISLGGLARAAYAAFAPVAADAADRATNAATGARR